MLYGFFLIVHIIVSVLLVVAILMQASKGGGLAGIAGGMGAGGGSSLLGGRQAATLLHKVTIGLALVFGINALLLGVLSRGSTELRSATLDAIAAESDYPLEFLGESEISPTDQQLQQAKDAVPTPEDGDDEAATESEPETE